MVFWGWSWVSPKAFARPGRQKSLGFALLLWCVRGVRLPALRVFLGLVCVFRLARFALCVVPCAWVWPARVGGGFGGLLVSRAGGSLSGCSASPLRPGALGLPGSWFGASGFFGPCSVCPAFSSCRLPGAALSRRLSVGLRLVAARRVARRAVVASAASPRFVAAASRRLPGF